MEWVSIWENHCQLRIVYPRKLIFKKEYKINKCSGKQFWVLTKNRVKEFLKDIL